MNVTGNDIKMMRECSGMSATEIATSLGLASSSDYDRWENDNDEDLPTMNEFIGFCMVCGFNPADLVKAIADKEEGLALEEYREMQNKRG